MSEFKRRRALGAVMAAVRRLEEAKRPTRNELKFYVGALREAVNELVALEPRIP